jgi:hypothetical protein
VIWMQVTGSFNLIENCTSEGIAFCLQMKTGITILYVIVIVENFDYMTVALFSRLWRNAEGFAISNTLTPEQILI